MKKLTKVQIVGIIARTFARLGGGLRVEEIAAASGLTEDQVWAGFKGRVDFQNKGDRGWFYTSTRPLADLMAA